MWDPAQPAKARTFRNDLLAGLPARDLAALWPHLHRAHVPQGKLLVRADEPLSQVVFLESGVASVIVRTPDGHQVESGLIGREGFVHPAVVLGADRTPCRVQVQVPGEAVCIPAAAFAEAVEASAGLRRVLLRFAEALSVQNACASLSYAVHSSERRLARWLLMCHDRIDGDQIALTHDDLATIFALRRPSVTNAMHLLEGHRLIHATRGVVTVIDREALERFAGDAYGIPEATYRRLLEPHRASRATRPVAAAVAQP